MPSTVSACLTKFCADSVDLPTDITTTARASRDFLYDQIATLGKTTLLTGTTESFGSFARRTKMQPLDDIDCLGLLEAAKTTEYYASSYTYNLYAASDASLQKYADTSGYVNSTLVLNAVKKALESVSQYSRSDLSRNGSAVVLNLKSYTWSFDVVPACKVNAADGTSRYLIPDGNAKWKRTDPRIDATRVTKANIAHDGAFLRAVRVLKYWNRRTHKPRLPSYYFETLLTNRALSQAKYKSLQNAIADLLYGVYATVTSNCSDPKGHEPYLDSDVSWDTKTKVQTAAKEAYDQCVAAITSEIAGDHAAAIKRYQTVFGPSFPGYS